jgi:hypothetical protein
MIKRSHRSHAARWPSAVATAGILRPRMETLRVDGRVCTKVVDGLRSQVARIETAIADEATPARGAMCFIDADWPLATGESIPSRVGVAIRGLHAARPAPVRRPQADPESRFAAAGVPRSAYNIGADENEAYCLTEEADGWHAFYSERGHRNNEHVFKDEADAVAEMWRTVVNATSNRS